MYRTKTCSINSITKVFRKIKIKNQLKVKAYEAVSQE
jgi:hypothetical protein